MTRDSLRAKLMPIFHDVFDDDSIVLRDETSAHTVRGWDSVANIRLLLSIEDEFGFKFEMGEYSEFRNVGDLLSGIERKLAPSP
jgi:acyl carrier protein